MGKGKNALLESPTGTGKTLCLLCSSLGWREHFISREIERLLSLHEQGKLEFTQEELSDANATPTQIIHRKVYREAPKIIYASRTHSQLSQVMEELKNCPYSPKASLLGSRKQLCINTAVTNKPANTQGNHCRRLVTQRKCRFQFRVSDYKNHHDFVDEPLAIEELVKLGREHNVCPYYISKEMQNDADIILVPYNYLIDPVSRRSLNIDLKGSILIFDEAHNLETVCTDAASFRLQNLTFRKCLELLQQCTQMASASSSFLESHDIKKESLQLLSGVLSRMDSTLMNMRLPAKDGLIKPGSYILEFLSTCGVTTDNYTTVKEVIDAVVTIVTEELSGTSTFYLEQLSSAISLVFADCGAEMIEQYFRVYIEELKPERQAYSRTQEPIRNLHFWCFNSGVAMRPLNASGIRSFILTSGTLSPLDSFSFELQTDFPIQLENPHVIDQSQIWVGVTSCGPSGGPLNTSFRCRNVESYIQELGNAIVNFCRIVPAGLLVFFSSYTVMEQYIDRWKRGLGDKTAVWDRIQLYKKPVAEPRDSSVLGDTIEDFYKKVRDPEEKGAVFFAVCRGKVSEGLDFANDNGRAVVVTGIPFPNIADQRVKLKQQYLDQTARKITHIKPLTGEEWYKQQASRAVNQAVGRVIRHRKDYGAIILCDERFGYTQNRNQLSSWLRPHTQTYSKFGDVSLGLTRFFKYAKANFVVPTKEKEPEEELSVTVNRSVVRRKKFVPPKPLHPPSTTSALGKRPRANLTKEESLKASFTSLTTSLGTSTPASPPSTKKSGTAEKAKKAERASTFIKQVQDTLSKEEYRQFQGHLRQYKKKDLAIEQLVSSVKDLFDTEQKRPLLVGFATFVPSKYKATYSALLADLNLSTSSTTTPTISSGKNLEEKVEHSTPPQNTVPLASPSLIEASQVNVIAEETTTSITTQSTVIEVNDDPPPAQLHKRRKSDNDLFEFESQVPYPAAKKKRYDLITGKLITSKTPSRSVQTKPESEPLPKTSKLEIDVEKEVEALNDEESEGGLKCSICRDAAQAPFSSRCGHICCKICWDQWLKEQLSCPVCRTRVRQKQLTKLFFT